MIWAGRKGKAKNQLDIHCRKIFGIDGLDESVERRMVLKITETRFKKTQVFSPAKLHITYFE